MVQGSPRGRPVSWAVVLLVILGFIIGGLALVLSTIWWLFWIGVGLVVLAIAVGWATGIMEDVH